MLKSIKRNPGTLTIHLFLWAIMFLCIGHAALAQDDEKAVTDEEVTIPGGRYFQDREIEQPVQSRQVPAPMIRKMRDDDDFWYANTNFEKERSKGKVAEPKKNPEERTLTEKEMRDRENAHKYNDSEQESYTPVARRPWFQALLWFFIIGGFAVVVVLYLNSSNVKLFRKKIAKTNAQEEELSTEDIFAINYQKEIDKAAAQGNYRLAIRLMFLRVLRNMADKNIINYKQDKTNLDYLIELHPTRYYKNFFRITRNYEYAWYGLFPISEGAYFVIRKEFDQFENEVAYV